MIYEDASAIKILALSNKRLQNDIYKKKNVNEK